MNAHSTPVLLIDAGNSRIKWAAGQTATPSIEAQGSAAQGDWNSLRQQWNALHGVQQIWLCNVAGALCADALRQLVQEKFPHAALHAVQAQARQCGVSNAYEAPETLGADRWMMAIAAHQLYPQQRVLIVSAGTATTIDALDAQGRFLGGVILPGLQLMQQSLARNTAHLPEVSEQHRASGLARNTHDAIASGCLQAQLGAVERLYRELNENGNRPDAQIVLTGGAAGQLAWQLQYPVHLQNHLVLTGLNILSQAK